MLMQQYKLKRKDSELICWLEANRVKIGDHVTLKNSDNPKSWWKIVEEYTKMELMDIKGGHQSYKWHENDFHGKIKGLKVFEKT